MGSPGHRDNLLNAELREIGVGYFRGGSWGHYWVQDLGARDGVYPLIINREAAATDSIHVALYLHGTWEQVRLRNDGGAWTSWSTFANEVDWTLPPGGGEHMVEAEMRKGGQTAKSGDTISLVAAPKLGGLPGELRFLYNRSEGRLLSGAARVTPRNVGNGDRFTWQATVTGGHFRGESLSGWDGEPFWIVPVGYELCGAGTYRGTATVTVTGLDGVAGSPQQIDLTLQVVDSSFQTIYLPLLVKE
jgi:hypothetical protein